MSTPLAPTQKKALAQLVVVRYCAKKAAEGQARLVDEFLRMRADHQQRRDALRELFPLLQLGVARA